MGNPLEGFVLKISRAEEHLESIKEMVDAFCESDFYETTRERYRKGRLVARAKNVSYPDPQLSILVGDCVFNYRSALDQLAYALAAANTDPLPPTWARKSAFPLFPKGWMYRGERNVVGAKPKMRGMSPTTRAAIERLQPYHRRKDPILASLARLEDLSNFDKHRLIHVTGSVSVRSRFQLKGPGVKRITAIKPVFEPIYENAILGHFWGDFDLKAGVEVNAFIAPEVVFDRRTDAESVRGFSVVLTLVEIRECIVQRVLPELDAELHRLFPDLTLEIKLGAPEIYERVPAYSSAHQAALMAREAGGEDPAASTKKGYT